MKKVEIIDLSQEIYNGMPVFNPKCPLDFGMRKNDTK